MIKSLVRILQYDQINLDKKGLSPDDGLPYIREVLFMPTIRVLLLIGILAYIPGVIMAIFEKVWPIATYNTFAMGGVLFIYFARKLSTIKRIYILLAIIYSLALFLLYYLGPFGASLIWLIGFSLIAAVFLGFKVAIITILINLTTILLIAFGIKFQITESPLFTQYTFGGWIAVSVNLIVVNSFTTLFVSIILERIQKSFKEEKALKTKLKEESIKLEKARIKAEESDQLKVNFLENISHEIRTPMNAIIGFSDLLQMKKSENSDEWRYLDRIKTSSEHLLDLINDIIEFSRLESSTLSISVSQINIQEILNDLLNDLKHYCPQNLNFKLKNHPKVDELYIHSDKARLSQVFSNLILNAFKFTEEGKVEFGVDKIDTSGNKAIFYVSDTGIGIKKSEQKVIFERFHKINQITPGAGLGLSISASLLHLMGGDIWVVSEISKGSKFCFSIPLNSTP